ncbi:MAG: hypothetical protein KGJ37_04080 [Verrucomicrobiota bacterium]|nr:hypothetical protein [Verrucomicrobiota bacterium]
MPPAPCQLRSNSQRGSVLIVALLLAALIAVALGSYLNLGLSSTRLAHRMFLGHASLNLVEAGAEEAVWSFNRTAGDDTSAWTAWSTNGVAAWQKFSNFEFMPNTSGWVKVYVDNYNPPAALNPKVIALASVDSGGGLPVTKMLEITLRRRSLFASGLVAQDTIIFNGKKTSVDSWNSDPDNDPSTAPIPYSISVRQDHGGVASTSVDNEAMLLNSTNVWGYVATGGGQPEVGTGGSIRGTSTPPGVIVDQNRISTDFVANFAPAVAPTDGTSIDTITSTCTLGTAGTATKWRCPGISLSGQQTLTILGNVTLIITASSGADAVDLAGQAAVIIPAGSSLVIYIEGDMAIAGQAGIGNSNPQPISCQIYGTNQNAAGQKLDVAGQGSLCCVIYAPNGDITLAGDGNMMGSVVGRDITLSGNAAFHYDESLANYGTSTPFGIGKWRELTTAADQNKYLSYFAGW